MQVLAAPTVITAFTYCNNTEQYVDRTASVGEMLRPNIWTSCLGCSTMRVSMVFSFRCGDEEEACISLVKRGPRQGLCC